MCMYRGHRCIHVQDMKFLWSTCGQEDCPQATIPITMMSTMMITHDGQFLITFFPWNLCQMNQRGSIPVSVENATIVSFELDVDKLWNWSSETALEEIWCEVNICTRVIRKHHHNSLVGQHWQKGPVSKPECSSVRPH